MMKVEKLYMVEGKRVSNFVGVEMKGFPVGLRETVGGLRGLYCLGNAELLKNIKMVAVVGSRSMSGYGKRVVRELVPELVKEGIIIVSGMAFGIDAEVHRVCLENEGKTVAVLASGVDIISPKGNRGIYNEILSKGGLIISEYKDGTTPDKVKFLERNRIVAGLSKAVMVVEGGRKSGTLVTARLASDYGKEVWAVPGRIDDENSFTPNYLIKNGAVPICEINDMISQI